MRNGNEFICSLLTLNLIRFNLSQQLRHLELKIRVNTVSEMERILILIELAKMSFCLSAWFSITKMGDLQVLKEDSTNNLVKLSNTPFCARYL